MFCLAEVSTPSSPHTRLSTSSTQFYRNNSSLLPLSHHTFNQNLALRSIVEQQSFVPQCHQSTPYGTYNNGYNTEVLTNDNQQIFDG